MDQIVSDTQSSSDGKGGAYSLCPIFNPDLKDNYEKWRTKAIRWSKITLVPKLKQGFAAAIALKGSADNFVTNIPDEELYQAHTNKAGIMICLYYNTLVHEAIVSFLPKVGVPSMDMRRAIYNTIDRSGYLLAYPGP